MSDSAAPFVFSDLGGDPDLGELVDAFVADLPDRIENLIDCYDRGDRHELRRAVHQMKGAAGSYGFHAVTPLASRLEQSLLSDPPEDRVKVELEELLALCRRMRSGTKQ